MHRGEWEKDENMEEQERIIDRTYEQSMTRFVVHAASAINVDLFRSLKSKD